MLTGHEDATEDFGIYEFVSIPGKMESAQVWKNNILLFKKNWVEWFELWDLKVRISFSQVSCRSLARLESAEGTHTIYDVIRHVPEVPCHSWPQSWGVCCRLYHVTSSLPPRRTSHHVLSASGDCWLEIFEIVLRNGPEESCAYAQNCVVLLLSTVCCWKRRKIPMWMKKTVIASYIMSPPKKKYYCSLSKWFQILIYAVHICPFFWLVPAKEDPCSEKC